MTNENAEMKALRRLVLDQRAREIAAVEFGDADFAPLIVGHLGISIANGVAAVEIVDGNGRRRTRFNSTCGKFEPLTPAALAQEITERHPALKRDGATEKAGNRPTTLVTAMAVSRAEATKDRAAANSALLARANAANPWSKPHVNLTMQMAVMRLDPILADKLKAEASA